MPLFSSSDLADWLETLTRAAVAQVDRASEQSVVDDAPEVAQKAIDRYSMDDIVLDRDGIQATPPAERALGRPAWTITLDVPYTGGGEQVFKARASQFTIEGHPDGFANDEVVHLQVVSTELTAAGLNASAKTQLEKLAKYVGWANEDLARYRVTLNALVRAAVDKRSKSIKARRDAAADLDFPTRPSQDGLGTSRRW